MNVSRNLAVKIHAFARPDGDEARRAADQIAGFAVALRDQLRRGASLRRLDGFEDEDVAPEHVPLWLVGRIYDDLRRWTAEERVRPEQFWPLDAEARELMNVCGACERIRNTPMPPSLEALTRALMFLVAAALPWVVHDEGSTLYVAAVTGIAAFVLFSVETTASVIEHPFGSDANQLRLTSLCDTIRRTVDQALGVRRASDSPSTDPSR